MRRHARIAVLVAAALLCAPRAGLALASPAKASVRLVAERESFAAGDRARLAAIVTIDEGWHVNSNQPTYDYLIATELELETPEGWRVESIVYPPGVMRTFSFEDRPLSVYEGEVAIVAELATPEWQGTESVSARLSYQACDDRSCLPPTSAEASLEVTVGYAGPALYSEIFEAAAAAPREGPAAPRRGLLAVLLLGLVGGLILNAMPCVLPVLSLKVFGLVKSAGDGRGAVVTGALATAAGILVSFWALALAAVVARAAGATVGWGVQFQEPLFVTFLTVVVLLFCLNLWGLFEIPLPAALSRLGAGGGREGVPGHFASGLFATLMATPCSAPFLGTALGFAFSQRPVTIVATFTAIGVGMALPYLAIAAYPKAMRWLPRPGEWMVTLRVVMGFLLAAAAVWLLYVLAAQLSPERLAFVQLALLTMALFVALRARVESSAWRRLAAVGTAVAITATLALAARAEPGGRAATVGESGLIPWETFDRGSAEGLAGEGRLVFVDVTADWCFTCKVNERLVLETPAVAEVFERHGVVAMKADWTNRDEDIGAFLAEHGRAGIPFYLLYRPGAEPHLFSELLTREEVVSTVEAAAGGS